MKLNAYPTLLKKLRNKQYRRAFRSASVRNQIALQIRTLRKIMFESQAKMAEAANKPTNVITRLENPNYGKMSVSTLLEIADTCDVGLRVRFVPFGDMALDTENLSDEALYVPCFNEEVREFSSLPERTLVDEKDLILSNSMQVGNAAQAEALAATMPQAQPPPTDLPPYYRPSKADTLRAGRHITEQRP